MDNRLGLYCISVHPTRINYYYEPLNRPGYRGKHTIDYEKDSDLVEGSFTSGNTVGSRQPEQFRNNYHYGKISKTAERKINRAIDYITYLAKPKRLPYTKKGKGLSFRLNFITLTLSSEQIHSDHEISVHIFQPFLNSLRQKWKCTNYIWRAERQENGSLHYHIITDRFIPWSELRDVWNKHQQSLGYVSRYRKNQQLWHRDGFRPRPDLYKTWPKSKQYKAWQEGCRHDWNSPNSTDVHSLRAVGNVKAYFKAYMLKHEQNSDIKGRLWGSSYRLTGLKGAQALVYSKISEELDRIDKASSIRRFTSDYYTTIFISPSELERLGCLEILSLFNQYITQVFPDYRPPEIFDG